MTGTQTDQNTPSIWEWKNTPHITKTTMEFGFAVAAIVMAGAAVYTAVKGVALSSALPAFLANPWVIAAIASYVAVYLVARSISSYQQISSIEGAQGKAGANGKDADFTILLGDAIVKGGTISTTEVEENDTKSTKLFLGLSKDNYDALTKGKNAGEEVTLHVVSAGESVEVKFNFINDPNNNSNYKVELTRPDKKEALGLDDKVTSLQVAVSDKTLQALKDSVSTKLANVAIEGVSKTTSKAA